MGRHRKYILRMLVFFVLAIYCVSLVSKVLLPKNFYNGDWATTSAYLDFYHMERDSVDVLFLGSSHCVAAFSPVELYERYGIKSYNLGGEQQSLVLSYYWLLEALRFQKPRYVFLDTFMLFPYDSSSPLNASEASLRKGIDFMRWSWVKVRAVRDICAIDGEQKLSGYFFPPERFHTRWKMLSEDDFRMGEMGGHESLMGFFPLNFACGDQSFEPLSQDGGLTGYEEMLPVMREYLDRITALCAEREINLVLTKSPTMFYSQEAFNSVNAYAFENGLEYIDFNEESVYRAAGLEFAADSCDTDHASIPGAMKISDYIGAWLKDKVPSGQTDKAWEKRAEYYRHYLKDESLRTETDLCRYLQLTEDDDYCVFLSAMGDASGLRSPETAEAFGSLGLDGEPAEGGYLAVMEAGEVLKEAWGEGVTEHQGTVRGGLVRYRIMSAGPVGGNDSSIVLNGGEISLKHPGLNIAVYCNDGKKLIDRVCFYAEQGEIRCIR
mgnify:CR=1 FL=1